MKKNHRDIILNLLDEYDFNKKSFVPGKTIIPPSGKVIDKDDILHIIDSAIDGWLTTGRFNEEFEIKLANFLGVKHLLTTNSGSSSNLIAFSALTSPLLKERSIKPGDEVITVAAGFPTTINPIIQNGCIPVFVDIDLDTNNIDTNFLDSALSSKTKAVMIAHSLGNPFNIDEVIKFCIKNNLWLIEDNCDALGSKYSDQYTGTFGHIGTLSFYPAHHITMGEGGAVFTNDDLLKKIMESFRDWGRDCYCKPGNDNTCGKRFGWKIGDLPEGYDHKYIYSHVGYNLKITDMQAACGLSQLNKLEEFINKRKHNHNLYTKLMKKKLEEFINLPLPTKKSDPSWFGFHFTLKEDNFNLRNTLVNFLNQNNIGTRLLFAGNVTRQPFAKNFKYKKVGELSNSDFVMNNGLWLGVYPGISDEMIEFVVCKIEEFFGLNFS